MNCVQFETRLNLVLDQRRSPAEDSALAAHAAICASCDELLADHMVLVASVPQIYLPRMSDGFAHRAVVAAGPVVVHHRRSHRLLLAACVALSSAAAMLLAISLVWKARQAGSGDGDQIVVTGGMNSADLIVGAPSLWSNQFAMAASGASLRLDEVERVAPGIRPLRHSLSMIFDALRRAFQTRHDPATPPADERSGHWAITCFALA
jgi:hypothetical protein